MDVTFERYETAGEKTRTETMTVSDTKWTCELSKFARAWFGLDKRKPMEPAYRVDPAKVADRAMPWEQTDVDGSALE